MSKNTAKKLVLVGLIGVTIVGVIPIVSQPQATKAASLDELKDQASALQQQIADSKIQAEALAKQADSLKTKIAEFDIQITQISTQIDLTNVKLQQLQAELDKAQSELDRQKELLKISLRALYKKGGTSSFELLVGSQSFSQFVNEQTYLERLKTGIQTSTEQVILLKQQITDKKTEQEALLKQQQDQKSQLDAARADKQSTLDATQGQEALYQARVKDLQAQQLEINRQIIARSRVLTGSDGGYPWKNVQPFNGYYDCPGFDSWGMCMRSCTSFAAWRVASTGRNMPAWGFYLYGIAKDWPTSANIENIPTGNTPQVGAVAVWTGGDYGHVAFVEEVYGDGSIRVSEYNYVNPGQYDERIPSRVDMPNRYIYFQ